MRGYNRDDPALPEYIRELLPNDNTGVPLPRSDARVASDGSAVYELPKTLRGYCQHEFMYAFEHLPMGECHYCGRHLFRLMSRGNRKDNSKATGNRSTQNLEAHEFCPMTNGVHAKCRHDFHNRERKLKDAVGATGVRIAGEPHLRAAGRA